MKGSPRSLMLTWANTWAGWWTSAAVTEIQRQRRALLNAAMKAATGTAKRKPAKRRKGRR